MPDTFLQSRCNAVFGSGGARITVSAVTRQRIYCQVAEDGGANVLNARPERES